MNSTDSATTSPTSNQPKLASENVLVHLKSVTEFQVGLAKRFDLYFTDSRMVFIDLGRGQAVGRAAFGVVGKAIAKRSENKDREKRGSLTLDQMIAEDPSSNYAVSYDQVSSIKLSPPSFVMKGSVEIKLNDPQHSKKFGLNNKDEYNSLKTTLPTVSALSAKISMK
jgi:hypothetical protein